MRKFSRGIGIILILIMVLNIGTASAVTWEFGTSGQGQNPFTPRGYLVDTDKGQHWLSSPYNNSGPVIKYSGVRNGLDYLPAKKSDGSNYTFYAMTDRNPRPGKSHWIGNGQANLFAYKDGVRISNFNSYITSAARGDKVDPSGAGTCWVLKIEGFQLEPGCQYEFGFLQGMQANNGITLVLAEDEEGNSTGYIKQTEEGLTSDEKSRYHAKKGEEFQFISSWQKKSDGKGYTVNRVPMRFSLQTYADLSDWEAAADKAEAFLSTVTEQDFSNGKYIRKNINNLRDLLSYQQKEAENTVKKELQRAADRKMRTMIQELEALLKKAKSERPEPTDLTKLLAEIKKAEKTLETAQANVGNDIGQYNETKVRILKLEIEKAKKMHKFTPQREVDEEVRALQDAIDGVVHSKNDVPRREFYDKITGIYVFAPENALPEDARLFVQQMGKETSEYRSIEQNLSKKETEAIFYQIQFYQGDKKIQPSKEVEVQMPIADNIKAKGSSVYAVGSKGSLNKVDTSRTTGTQNFFRKTLNAFVLAGSTATEKEKAKKRGEKMKAITAVQKGRNSDNKENQLEKDKKKKEEYKDPLNKILKRNQNAATFSNDVRKESNSFYLVIVAAVLAAIAVTLGIRGMVEQIRDHARKKVIS